MWMGTRQKRRSRAFLVSCLLVATLWPDTGRADIYSYIDKDGVVHFTNIPRRSKKWKRVMKTGPGKASAPRGRRVDRVPPSDRSSSRYHRHDRHIEEAAALYHIPVPLVRAVVSVESDFDPRVVSRAGAQGLMQLMPFVSKGMGVTNPFDPRQNIFGGVRFLRILANRFAGDLVLTIASYHAGAGAVRKYGGIPPYETTQKYVRWVLSRYYRNIRVASR